MRCNRFVQETQLSNKNFLVDSSIRMQQKKTQSIQKSFLSCEIFCGAFFADYFGKKTF
jgi:hypothetical protein